MAFDMLAAEEIASERATDAYFDRTVETLDYSDLNPRVVAEVSADQFPTGTFDVAAGLKDAAQLLRGLPVDVDAVREGVLFDGGPVLRIEGQYRDFCRVETSLLGFLSHASGAASNALDVRRAAPDSPVFSFGTRHVHPAIAPMIERSAMLAGLDGFSHVAAGEVIGRQAGGTMPHSLLLCFGKDRLEEAWQAFDEAVDEAVPRVALCDTFSDEVDESLRAAEAVDELDSVRLDTTASRRGDFQSIIREVRWELDAAGFEDIDIFASGGLGPEELRQLRDFADGFGVGSYISNADPIEFALDIVEVEGEPTSKRGKLSGAKQVYRTPAGGHHIGLARSDPPGSGEPLLEPLIRDGEIVRDFDLSDATDRCANDAERVLGRPE